MEKIIEFINQQIEHGKQDIERSRRDVRNADHSERGSYQEQLGYDKGYVEGMKQALQVINQYSKQ